jgi:hypothetical protein
MPSSCSRRRHRKQRGGAQYTFTKEFHATIFMDNDDSDAHNTYVDLATLDAAEVAPLSASILTYFQNYAEFLKNPDGNPFAKGILETYVDAHAMNDIVNYVDNITYRHLGGDRFEVSFDLNLPDSNNGEPNLGFSNGDKEDQRDNIFDVLINKVEHFYDESIEYGDEIIWTVAASEDEIDYTRFDGPYEMLHDGAFLTEANELLIGAGNAGIIPKPPADQVNTISLAPFEYDEDVIIIREAGFDHKYKRDGLLAYFTNRIATGLPLTNPATNTHIINPDDPLPDPPVFDNGIVFLTGRIAPPPEGPQLGGKRRSRKHKRATRRRHRSSHRSRRNH